jgi:acyl dehydratase
MVGVEATRFTYLHGGISVLARPAHTPKDNPRTPGDSVRRVNTSIEGKVYPDVAFDVAADRVAAFRAVFGERREVVPPTFLTAAEFTSFPAVIEDPELALDFARVVHGDQEYEWRRQPRVGERLVARSRIASARARGGTAFLTIETELRDADGETVAVCRATMIERGDERAQIR